MNAKTDYARLAADLEALTRGVPYETANLANGSALLWERLPEINWVGFYTVQPDGNLLLGPFQGKPACIRIKAGRGVCGTALAEKKTLRVADVHAFPGHIACDSASRAEIVVPVMKDGKVYAVLDVDSPFEDRFTAEDEAFLTKVAALLAEKF